MNGVLKAKNVITGYINSGTFIKKCQSDWAEQDIENIGFIKNKPTIITQEQLAGKQDKLVAGENISIVNNVISASAGGSLQNYYTKQEIESKNYATQQWVENKHYLTNHQSLANYALKSELPTVDVTKNYVDTEVAKKQNILTAGDNITIDGNTISAAGADVNKAYVDGIKSELNGDIANRVNVSQGVENAGKYLKVNASGTVECAEVGEWETLADVELEEASRVIEFSPEALVAKKLNSDYKHLLVAMYIPKNAEATSNFIIRIMLGRNNPFDSDSMELYFPQSPTWGGLQAGYNIYCSIMIDFVRDAIMVTQRNNAYSAITYPQNAAGTTYITNNKDKEKLSKNEKIYVCVACNESVYPSFPIGTKIKLYAR